MNIFKWSKNWWLNQRAKRESSDELMEAMAKEIQKEIVEGMKEGKTYDQCIAMYKERYSK